MKLTIKMSRDFEGRFRAWRPALTGCSAVCKPTREQATVEIRRAVEALLNSLDASGPTELVFQTVSSKHCYEGPLVLLR